MGKGSVIAALEAAYERAARPELAVPDAQQGHGHQRQRWLTQPVHRVEAKYANKAVQQTIYRK